MQQRMQQAQQQREETKADARKKQNPVPSGRPGLQILRALSDCPIPEEAGQIKKLLDKLLTMELSDVDEPLKIVGEGIAAVVMADTYCYKHKTKRPAVRFADDEDLQQLHKDTQDLEKRQAELEMELATVAQQAQKTRKARWDTAVEKFGLAPEKFSYEMDEDEGVIYLVDLRCNECTGRAKTRKARQKVAEELVAFERQTAEGNNDGNGKGDSEPAASEGDADKDGETSTPEQEVSGVDDKPVSADSDGDNSSSEAD